MSGNRTAEARIDLVVYDGVTIAGRPVHLVTMFAIVAWCY